MSKTRTNKKEIIQLFICILFVFWSVCVFAQTEAQVPMATPGSHVSLEKTPLHMSCSKSLRDLKSNKLECFGNVYIRRQSELLTSDYAILDLNTNDLHAEGNVVYFTSDTVIYGSKMDFNFNTETGLITEGRVENEKYELVGEVIEKIGERHYRAKNGEYTTCRDCPASWRLMGKSVDMTVNGYAFLNQVFVKLNESPTFYIPYLIVPVKTRRQTGLLFPKTATSQQDGFTFVEPFFWAISDSTDATIGLGFYTKKGMKGEGQFRYILDERSHGELNAFYLKDKVFIEPYQNRWALNYSHNLELPWKLDQRLKWLDASDRDYPSRYPSDIPGAGEPGLISEAGISRADRDFTVWVTAKRVRNLLTSGLVGFDPNTVQLMPGIAFASVDHKINSHFPLHWGIQGNYSRFDRKEGPFDRIYAEGFTTTDGNLFIPGQTPLRKAHRFNLVPELYYTGRLWKVLEVLPSVQYRSYYYIFDDFVPPTTRGYLVAQTELATTVENIYGGRVKHKIRPSLTYSNIPVVQQDEQHAFIKQIRTSGNQLDDGDIVPISNESQVYFVPLGSSMTYRLGHRFILKSDKELNSYKKIIDIVSGQSINFIEYQKDPNDRKPFSRFFTNTIVDTDPLRANLEYFYYPYSRASTYNLGLYYTMIRSNRRLLSFERGIGLNYNYNQVTSHTHSIGGNFNFSLNYYLSVNGGVTYQFPMGLLSAISPGLLIAANVGAVYQSPSQCYQVVVNAVRNLQTGWAVSFNLPVNLGGEGFFNITDSSGGVPGANIASGLPGQR